ncbi:MAG: SpoIIE family protein phosphatase [Actinomycetota bacterium]|nr:SpoIIE family protein phosphatase [Actinomycetota bacterium]
MSAQENEGLVRWFFEEAWVKGNLTAVDEYIATNYVEHTLPPGSQQGRDALKQFVAMYHEAFPDVKVTMHDIFGREDRVAYRWSASGTHLGAWMGVPPTGLHLTTTGITIHRIVGGKCVEGWVSVDISRSKEEQQWLSEGGRTEEAYLEEVANLPPGGVVAHHSSVNEDFIRNLTWRFRAAQVQERERIEQELQVARQIQQELLPESVPELDGWQIATYYAPTREVGGDFYDFVELSGGRLGLIVGDATGHGMPAALVMATTRGMLRAVVQSLESSPGEVLVRVNEALVADIPPSTFVTCFYGVLDPKSGSLLYANAGHDLPCRRNDGQAEELSARGMPLGLMPGTAYEEKQVVLESGDMVLFYSDGLVEAHNPQREMFGFPRLRRLVAEHTEQGSLVDSLMDELSSFTGDGWEQEDDITLVTLRRA